jgi:hypothetical protein
LLKRGLERFEEQTQELESLKKKHADVSFQLEQCRQENIKLTSYQDELIEKHKVEVDKWKQDIEVHTMCIARDTSKWMLRILKQSLSRSLKLKEKKP